MSIVADFLKRVQAVHATGQATEHSYRPALQDLLSGLRPDVTALNEPKRVACGAPDFLVARGEIVVGHVEAKDLGHGIRTLKDANKAQQERYLKALPNLAYTNCLDWDFYRDGTRVASITVADHLMGGLQPHPTRFDQLENLLRDFVTQRPLSITSPRALAEIMAGKAGLIKDVLGRALLADKDGETELWNQYKAFKDHLIHDITPADFADIYAETVAYGMFAARLHDATPATFSRQEALELLPRSNPFLRSLFGYVAGPDLDPRIRWIIDDLAEAFGAADMGRIMEGFGRLTGREDPFVHFYETFLAAYNPAKRKARGVWYTPAPVVNFIVRAVDEVLRTEFGLPDGLADTSKVVVDWDTGQKTKAGKPVTIKKEVHRVQVLDPATGTGTFLAEVVKQVAPRVKGVAEGMWSEYVERDLIPRLHGFELLMASYAMCHTKLDMILTELGYRPTGTPPRLGVYLTNSLEEGEAANYTLPFAQWLSNEVREANTIKRDMPIMCVIGNPPYLGEGGVSEGWMGHLLSAYKREPGGAQPLQERNSKWLNDLYVKFIRLAEYFVTRNGEGVVSFITNHGYIENPTFRGMRWHLLRSFDKIYIFDLHGNVKMREVSPGGEADENVFDIQQGVAILVAVRARAARQTRECEVFRADLWGDRETKYSTLFEADLTDATFQQVRPVAPTYCFSARSGASGEAYEAGLKLRDLFPVSVTGFQTGDDRKLVSERRDTLISKFGVEVEDHIQKIVYRPWDDRYGIYFSSSALARANGVEVPASYRPRYSALRHLLQTNVALLVPRRLARDSFQHSFVCDKVPEMCVISNLTREQNVVLPLYAYPDIQDLNQTRRVNLDPKLFARLQSLAAHPDRGAPDELAVFDYVYGVLHCPAYREAYAEFLRIDFPRIPWPASPSEFWDVAGKGGLLRRLHLMEPEAVGPVPYPFRGDGDGTVEAPRFEGGAVWVNKTQRFEDAPAVAWTHPIGGYLPAQKWLKDRKGRRLSFEDVRHYQRILKVLSETDRIMRTITMTLDAPASV